MANDYLNQILYYKKAWDDADKVGDNVTKKSAADNAKAIYQKLYGSGDSAQVEQALNLESKNYGQAVEYVDNLATGGLSHSRSYIANILKNKYGYDVTDKDITYNDATKEVSLGGVSLGKAGWVTNSGKAYYDPAVLDKGIQGFVSANGIARSPGTLYDDNNETITKKSDQQWEQIGADSTDIKNKYNQVFGIAVDTNPYDTEAAKSIMADYKYQGGKASDNEIASGAASNGGNIDSFAAANALRQQAGFTALGNRAVLADHNARIGNALNVLNGLGVYNSGVYGAQNNNIGLQMDHNQQIFDNDYKGKQQTFDNAYKEKQQTFDNGETAANNKVSRDMTVTETFGEATGNEYTNEYIGQNIDFKAAHDAAKASGASEEVLNKIAEARFKKQVALNDFSAGVIPFTPTVKQTSAEKIALEQIKAGERMALAGNETTKAVAATDAQSKKEVAATGAQNNLDVVDKQVEGQIKLKESGVSTDNKPTLTSSQAKEAYDSGVRTQAVVDAYNYYYGTDYKPEGTDGGNGFDGEAAYEDLYSSVDKSVQPFLNKYIYNKTVGEAALRDLIVKYSKDYDIEIDDAKKICDAYGFDSYWLDEYKNAGLFGWGGGIKKKE